MSRLPKTCRQTYFSKRSRSHCMPHITRAYHVCRAFGNAASNEMVREFLRLFPHVQKRHDKPMNATTFSGQTLRGLIFIIYLLIFLRSVPKTQSAHEWDLEVVSGADCWCNLDHFSRRGRSWGSRGPLWSPRGRKSAQKPRTGFIILSSLRSAPRKADALY